MPPADWIDKFLTVLSQSPNVAAAARAAGVGRRTVYDHKAADPEFARAWEDAQEEATDHLVGAMYRRAVEGTEKPIFYEGQVCGYVREFSDTLAKFLAQAHRPAVFRERVEQHHAGEVKIVVEYVDAPPSDHPSPPGPGGDPPGSETV